MLFTLVLINHETNLIEEKNFESILDFIKSGSLRQINFNNTYDDVIKLWGIPECIHKHSRKNPAPSIIKFGILELYFSSNSGENSIVGIQIQPLLNPCPVKRMVLEISPWESPMNSVALEKYLKENLVKFSWEKDFMDQESIITESGVIFHFHENGENLVVQKFGKFKV